MRYFMPGIFDDIIIQMADHPIRRIRHHVPVKGDPTLTYDYVEEHIPAVDIRMSRDNWNKIQYIMDLYTQDIRNPALRDLADQYHMITVLGAKND